MKTLDLYIIKKFLGTFFFALILIIGIAIIFDFSEKIDDFLENNAPFKLVITEYYFNFIPYFAVLFSSLFTFIAVIFFTSRMAFNTEIIAILSSGVSFKRLLVPYFISALIIAAFSFVLNNYVIPVANQKRFAFEDMYYHKRPQSFKEKDVHKQIEPGIVVYLESYNTTHNYGRKFSIEKYEDGQLKSKLLSDDIRWDTIKNKWIVRNYYIRDYLDNGNQHITTGFAIDTAINMKPEEFSRRENAKEAMKLKELNEYIDNQKLQGSGIVTDLLIEKYKRFSFPFATFILTLIGVSVSSRKIRGGLGMHIGIGLLISFSYLLFLQFSSQFAIGGSIPPLLAVWIPNIVFSFVAVYLYSLTPK
ncbi:MAG: LptF/LptG family permease [Bacteroidales bacterium]|nr:LptF/LptG family permease [Bacteroidales bacterium]